MMGGPPLDAGEEVLFDHVPAMAAFKRTALIVLGLTLVPTVVIAVLLPGTAWVAAPLFVNCVILVQERMNLGRYRAWITSRRIILQGDGEVALADVTLAEPALNGVRVRTGNGTRGIRLHYPPDRAALARAIMTAKETAGDRSSDI